MNRMPSSRIDVSRSLDRLSKMQQPSEVQLSDDGKRLAFVVQELSTPSGRKVSNIWGGPLSDEPQQITSGPGRDYLPCFSPHEHRLAFVSDRRTPGHGELYLIQSDGEGEPCGDIPGSVELIRWFPEGERRLAVLARVTDPPGQAPSGPQSAAAALEDEDPEVRSHGAPCSRLFVVDPESGETRRIGPDGHSIWDFTLHDGFAVAVISQDLSGGTWYDAWIAKVDLSSGAVFRLHTPDLQVECPRMSPDGCWLAWIEGIACSRGALSGTLTFLNLHTQERRCLGHDMDITSFEWISTEYIRVCGERGLGAYCGVVDFRTGALEDVFYGDMRLGASANVAIASDAACEIFATVREATGLPPEVALLSRSAPELGWREVSNLNQHLKELPVPDARKLTWTAPDGQQVEGLLIRPKNAEGPLPLVVNVHGGPTARWDWSFAFGRVGYNMGSLFAEAGYALLLPNPRGSTGRGRAYAMANIGDFGGGDLEDVLAGVETCIEQGITERGRIGIMGGSYGGFMAAWAISHSDIFAAAVSICGDNNWLSFHNTSSLGGFDKVFLGADPYDPNGPFLQRSPVMRAKKISTPTLFLHGALDPIVPLGQAEEMHHAIAEAGCLTELVVYPREEHMVFNERSHFVDAWQRIHSWMDCHLLGVGQCAKG